MMESMPVISRMKFRTAILGLIAGAVMAQWAQAHHSANAAFTTNIIEVEGTVTEFNFTNPHIDVFFDVTGEDGEVTEWRASGSAANLMRRRGWTARTIQPGQYMRISGREAHNGVPMVLLGNMSEVDPTDGSLIRVVEGESDYVEPVGAAPLALTLDDGRPNFTGAWTMGPGGGMAAGGMGAGGMAAGGMGGGPGDRTPPPYNEAGAAAAAVFDPVSDPVVACVPPGLVRQAAFTPHPVRMTQLEDRIILEYEEYGGRREILLDTPLPEDVEHTHLGYSTARYDGDTLVIESGGLLENYTSPLGNPVSDQTTTVETYRRMDDPDIGAALALETVITDPAYLTGPWTLRWLKYHTPDYEFIPVDCRVPPVYQPPE